MGEMNLYLIKYKEFYKSSTGAKYNEPNARKTVVANGDALAAVEKLKKDVLKTSWEDDEDDEGNKLKKPRIWKVVDVKVHHVERIAEIDIP